jgi:hypothetical protein
MTRWEPVAMSIAGQNLIDAFAHLSSPERIEVLRVLLSRTTVDASPSDDDLVAAAHDVFLQLDKQESQG